MEIILGKSQSGKTHYLLSWVKEGRKTGDKRAIVVAIKDMARIFVSTHGLSEDEVFTINEAVNKKGHSLAFDELEHCLDSLFNGKGLMATITTDNTKITTVKSPFEDAMKGGKKP